MELWNSLSSHWRRLFGKRVQKIPLDAGATCPNRDGTLSVSGCTFCNAIGAGSGMGLAGMSIAEQWAYWREHFRHSTKAELFIAYLQSFSNTYGPPERLARLLDALRPLPDLAGLSVGTRPDCIDAEKAAMLAAMPCRENWLELGVQTFKDSTLQHINRGHDAACSVRAIKTAAAAGLSVCVHLMAGLPGENENDFLEAVRRINDLPVHGVKFHNTYICKNTALVREFMDGTFVPMEREPYIDLVVRALCMLRPDIVVHRIVADPSAEELLAPVWPLEKHQTVMAVERRMREIRRNEQISAPRRKRRRRPLAWIDGVPPKGEDRLS